MIFEQFDKCNLCNLQNGDDHRSPLFRFQSSKVLQRLFFPHTHA